MSSFLSETSFRTMYNFGVSAAVEKIRIWFLLCPENNMLEVARPPRLWGPVTRLVAKIRISTGARSEVWLPLSRYQASTSAAIAAGVRKHILKYYLWFIGFSAVVHSLVQNGP